MHHFPARTYKCGFLLRGVLLSATFFILVYEYVVAFIIAENSMLSRVMDEHLVVQVDEPMCQCLYFCTIKQVVK